MIRIVVATIILLALVGCSKTALKREAAVKESETTESFDPTSMVKTDVEGVYAYKPPPASFNPDTASDEELERYGFPPLSNQPNYHLPKFDVIVPTVQATKHQHRPTRVLAEKKTSLTTGTSISPTWSGYAVTVPTGTFTQARSMVFTTLKVPIPNCTSAGGGYHLSAWPGIDGYNNADVTSPDVLQGGVEMDATCLSPGKARIDKRTAWIEWFPLDEVDVNNFPVNFAEQIQVMVWWDTQKRLGRVALINVATHKGPVFALAPPSGTHLLGNTAEWIIERPGINGQTSTLTPYGQSIFTFARANVNAGSQYYIPQEAPTSSGAVMYQVQMQASQGSPPISIACRPCATSSPSNDEEILFRYVLGLAQNQCPAPNPNCTGQ
jgi:hypothetical protein